MKQIITDFFSFIRKPKDFQYSGNDKSYKWKVFFTLFGLKLLFLVIYIPLANLIDQNFNYEHSFDEKNFTLIQTIISIVIAAPIIEEIVFRFGLRRQGFLKRIFSEKRWVRYFPFLIYSSSITFGFVHLGNYSNFNFVFLFVAPIMLLSNLFGGFILAFIRVRFTIVFSILFHVFWNSFALFVIDGSYYFINEDRIEIKNTTYDLTIQPKQFLPLKPSIVYYNANIDTIYNLTTHNRSIDEIINIISPLDTNYFKTSTLVEFQFKSEKGISKDSLLNILETEGYIEKKAKTN